MIYAQIKLTNDFHYWDQPGMDTFCGLVKQGKAANLRIVEGSPGLSGRVCFLCRSEKHKREEEAEAVKSIMYNAKRR